VYINVNFLYFLQVQGTMERDEPSGISISVANHVPEKPQNCAMMLNSILCSKFNVGMTNLLLCAYKFRFRVPQSSLGGTSPCRSKLP
jgi:hypothetical protein